MKKTVLALAAALALAPAGVATAAKGGKSGDHRKDAAHQKNEDASSKRGNRYGRAVNGVVVSAADGKLELSVRVKGERGKKATEVLVFDVAGARLLVRDTNGDGVRDWADVRAGDRAKVQGRFSKRRLRSGDGLVARRVTVKPPKSGDDDDASAPSEPAPSEPAPSEPAPSEQG